MSSSGIATENPIILNIMPSYGAVLVGCFLSQAVWGISTLQVFFYFKNFEHDTLSLKFLVVGLWLVDLANEIALLKSEFRVLILEYGRIAGLAANNIETTISTFVTSVMVFVVQLYFTRRIYLFGKERLWIKALTIVWIILATWQIVGPILYFSRAIDKPLAEQGKPFYADINISLRAAAFFTDVTLALCMIWLLTQNQGPFLSSHTRKMIFRILIVTINSGTWTALVALTVLILAKLTPGTFYFCIPSFTLCSLYFSTFLANLNSRNYVRGEGGITTVFGTNIGSSGGGNAALEFRTRRSNHPSFSNDGAMVADTSSESATVITKGREVYLEPEYITTS